MIDPEKIIYSINIDDIQNVAEQELERKLTAKELRLVEGKVGDYINWYEASLMQLMQQILNHEDLAAKRLKPIVSRTGLRLK
ncbi:MAG: hypothetical protein BROFUL_00388 [Candidatus Brocadia fulgida]|uniref:Uncharacterized protein n=1 Tax=Candidatus Brocadia fulgida TaxID=380242 RepID=A0A0M2V153_9BACT|nr:MAG: hypothetical protein BROFUL_00388 [Candidatus Brocadia fulgida]